MMKKSAIVHMPFILLRIATQAGPSANAIGPDLSDGSENGREEHPKCRSVAAMVPSARLEIDDRPERATQRPAKRRSLVADKE
jgi:hypothetical protein